MKESEEHEDSDDSGGEERVASENEGSDEEDEGEEDGPRAGEDGLNDDSPSFESREGTLGDEGSRET